MNAAIASSQATNVESSILRTGLVGSSSKTVTSHAYQIWKRGNSLRVMAEAARWGERGARISTFSPRIIVAPLARDELTGPRGAGYRRMIELLLRDHRVRLTKGARSLRC